MRISDNMHKRQRRTHDVWVALSVQHNSWIATRFQVLVEYGAVELAARSKQTTKSSKEREKKVSLWSSFLSAAEYNQLIALDYTTVSHLEGQRQTQKEIA